MRLQGESPADLRMIQVDCDPEFLLEETMSGTSVVKRPSQQLHRIGLSLPDMNRLVDGSIFTQACLGKDSILANIFANDSRHQRASRRSRVIVNSILT